MQLGIGFCLYWCFGAFFGTSLRLYECCHYGSYNTNESENAKTTFNNGYLGSRNDDERSEMRYVMWIAEFSESSNPWTQLALAGPPASMPVRASVHYSSLKNRSGNGSALIRWCWGVKCIFTDAPIPFNRSENFVLHNLVELFYGLQRQPNIQLVH